MAGLVTVGLAAVEIVEMSFMASRSYGKWTRNVQRLARAIAIVLVFWLGIASPAGAAERPVKIVALGDSLTAGYQLPASAAFPAQLQHVLKGKGIAVEIANAGVSGDTSSSGLARLDWSVPEGTDAVILALGANDMLRGIDPKVTRAALAEIVGRLKARRIEVLLCGMLAPPNLGSDFERAFNAIYTDLAAQQGLVFYPFLLDGVAANAALNQRDGLHPTESGVAAMVAGMMPKVEELIARVRGRPARR
jgi:acyl-CoA thioesterase I